MDFHHLDIGDSIWIAIELGHGKWLFCCEVCAIDEFEIAAIGIAPYLIDNPSEADYPGLIPNWLVRDLMTSSSEGELLLFDRATGRGIGHPFYLLPCNESVCQPVCEEAGWDASGPPPQSVQPQFVQPQFVQPQSAQPKSLQPKFVQPKSLQPKSVQPQSVQPQSVQPQSVQPQSVQPSEPASAPPNSPTHSPGTSAGSPPSLGSDRGVRGETIWREMPAPAETPAP